MSFNDSLHGLLSRYAEKKTPISINFRDMVGDITNCDRFTHFIHPYPAKLLQHIPFYFLNNTILSNEGDTVLDPFCGTGTVLLEGLIANRKVVGVDINPLAHFISKVKLRKLNPVSLRTILNSFELDDSEICPIELDLLKSEIGYWYNEKVFYDLLRLKKTIDRFENDLERDFFRLCFSVCAKKMSATDQRVSVPVKISEQKASLPGKQHLKNHLDFINKSSAFDVFKQIVNKNISRVGSLSILDDNSFDSVRLVLGSSDDDNFSFVEQGTIQLIISSPPYVSAQKYIRSSKVSMKWLGLDLLQSVQVSDQLSIGRENFKKSDYMHLIRTGLASADQVIEQIYDINPLRACITSTYLVEMKKTFLNCFSSLKVGGFFVMIIGDNTVSGIAFKTHEYLMAIAEEIGFTTKLVLIDDIQSRGLMTKRNKSASVITREYVVVFSKA